LKIFQIVLTVNNKLHNIKFTVSDRGQKFLNIGGKFIKKVIENAVTKVSIVDESGDPVLDDSGNPTFNEVPTPTECEEVLLNIGN